MWGFFFGRRGFLERVAWEIAREVFVLSFFFLLSSFFPSLSLSLSLSFCLQSGYGYGYPYGYY